MSQNYPIKPESNRTILSGAVPERTEVFHWRGDTFDISEDAIALVESDACVNQDFIFDNRVIAFQFHLETTFDSASALIENCRDELNNSEYVQSEPEIFFNPQRFENINKIMFSILNTLERENA